MQISEVRRLVLQRLNQMSIYELRQQNGTLYPSSAILKIIAMKLPNEAYEYIRDTNNLARASLESAIDKNIEEREKAARQPMRRKRKRY